MQLEELNKLISEFIYNTKVNNPDMTWDTLADVTNDEFSEYETTLTGNATRKRFKRFSEAYDGNPSDVVKTPQSPIYNEKQVELEGNSDVIAQLRQQFGISDEFIPRKIKTTSTDDKTWYGAEWVREAVADDKLQAVIEFIENHRPKYLEFDEIEDNEESLLVPILYDAHVDKASLNGGKTYIAVVHEMIETALRYNINIGRVMFVIGNDFGNFDNVWGNTTAGTPQDNSFHWARSVDIRCQYAISAVESFASIANTDVIMVHGNHDRYSNKWLGKVLEAQFKDNVRVTVDNGDSPRKYYNWQQNCWGFVHGNEENPSMLPAIMATEYPNGYAFATYREVFTGHFHRKQSAFYPLTEQNGMTIRWMPALSGTDDWHNLKGYVGARRAGLGIVYGQNGYKMEYSIDV
jgi:hypothetical protein